MQTITVGSVLVIFLLALLVGFIIWFVATLLPPFKAYAPQIGVAAFIIVLVVYFLSHAGNTTL